MFRVSKRYGAQYALNTISLDIKKNDFMFISGPSGAGKTTLMRMLYLGEKASEGQILINGVNLSRIPKKKIPALRRKFGIIFQDFKLIPSKTVYENISLVLEATGVKQKIIQKKVRTILRIVGMENKIDSYPPGLSGGEQQRVAIARAVIGDPEIILADEPTGSLDIDSATIVIKLLKVFHKRGATVIVASHNKELVKNTKGRIVFLKKGALQEHQVHINPTITEL